MIICIKAILGEDYVGIPAFLFLHSGLLKGAHVCADITIVNDGHYEGIERVTLKLLSRFPGVNVVIGKSVLEIVDDGNNVKLIYSRIENV